jgi:hypothetical protein
MIGDRTIGTCSICGGAVTVPGIWGAIVTPVPTCSGCGATKRESHGPVIDMQPRRISLTPHQRAKLLAYNSDASLWNFVNLGILPPD